jgi:phosphoglycolate phosphatase-like HAD superfamily hydrolase
MAPPNPHAKLWLFDFDNTLAALEREVDWPGSRRELEAYLRAEDVGQEIFAEIPQGNLPLYAALHSRWLRAPLAASRAASAIRPRVAAPGGAATRGAVLPPDAAAPPLVVVRSAVAPGVGAAACTAVMPLARAEALLCHASEIIERHELIGADRAAPTPGAIDLLRAIAARGAAVIIVSSNSSRTVAHWLDRHRSGDLVRAVVGRDSLLALKPSTEMIARALELARTFAPDAALGTPSAAAVRATASADAAAFVGDSLADFEAARATGLGFYGIAATDSTRDRLITAGATNIFASPAALRIHLNPMGLLITPRTRPRKVSTARSA